METTIQSNVICTYKEGFADFIQFTKKELSLIMYWGECLGYDFISNDSECICWIKGVSKNDERRFGEIRKIRKFDGEELLLYGYLKPWNEQFTVKYPINRNLKAFKIWASLEATGQLEDCLKLTGFTKDELDMQCRLPDFEEEDIRNNIRNYYHS